MCSGSKMRVRVKSANAMPLTRDTIIAARLNPVLLYDQRVPGGKFRACWWLTISSTCACVYTRVVRGQPAMPSTLPQSRSPLVWLSMWRISSGVPKSGSSAMYFLTGSSSDSFPSRASSSTAAAVNCFDTDPASKIVSGVFFTSCSRSAMPYALVSAGLPSTATPTAHPGVAAVHFAKIESTCEASSAAMRGPSTRTLVTTARMNVNVTPCFMATSHPPTSISPHLARRRDDPFELRPLLILGDVVAVDRDRQPWRREVDVAALPLELGLDRAADGDAFEPLEKVDVKEGPPVLAVGDAVQADRLLLVHHVADGSVLHLAQLVLRDLLLTELIAG